MAIKGLRPALDVMQSAPVKRALRKLESTVKDHADKFAKTAAKVVAKTDCANPACPYRDFVLAERARQRDKAAKWRAKRKGKP